MSHAPFTLALTTQLIARKNPISGSERKDQMEFWNGLGDLFILVIAVVTIAFAIAVIF